MRTAPRVIALALVSVLALAGCIRVDMNLTLHEDDTASGEFIMAVSKELAELIGDEDLGEALGTEDIEGAISEPWEDEEYVGTRTTFENVALTEVSDSTMMIVHEGDEFVVTGTPDDLQAQAGGEEIPSNAEATLSITFPGEVSEHNGTLEGTTVTWDLLDPPATIEARGSASADGGGIPLWIIIVVFAVMGIGIGVAVVLITSTRRKGPESEASAAAEADAARLVHGDADAPVAPTPEVPEPDFVPEPGAPEPTLDITAEPGVVASDEEALDAQAQASEENSEKLDEAARAAEAQAAMAPDQTAAEAPPAATSGDAASPTSAPSAADGEDEQRP